MGKRASPLPPSRKGKKRPRREKRDVASFALILKKKNSYLLARQRNALPHTVKKKSKDFPHLIRKEKEGEGDLVGFLKPSLANKKKTKAAFSSTKGRGKKRELDFNFESQ